MTNPIGGSLIDKPSFIQQSLNRAPTELKASQFLDQILGILETGIQQNHSVEFMTDQIYELVQKNPNLVKELKFPDDYLNIKQDLVNPWKTEMTNNPEENAALHFVRDIIPKKELRQIVENKVTLSDLPEPLQNKLKESFVEKTITKGIRTNQSAAEIALKIFKKLPKEIETNENLKIITNYVKTNMDHLFRGATDVSLKGAEFIADYERLRNRPYDDKTAKVITDFDQRVGTVTIGYGHAIFTKEEFEEYKNGISHEQAVALFKKDLKKYVDAVNRLVKVPLTQNQFDALVSFTYNIGIGSSRDGKKIGFLDSKVLELVNSGSKDPEAIRKAFATKNTSGGVPKDGLILRRKDEAEIFLYGEYDRTPKSWLKGQK